MNRLWIIGAGDSARWHLGESRKSTYGTGRHYYARCTGKQVYSVWGVSHVECERPKEIEHAVCKRCDRLLTQETA